MASKFNLTNIWSNVKELDLQQIRRAAEKEVRLLIVGTDPDSLQSLANLLRSDPRRPAEVTYTPVPQLSLEQAGDLGGEDLILLVATTQPDFMNLQAERLAAWSRTGRRVLILVDPQHADHASSALITAGESFSPVYAAPDDWAQLHAELAPKLVAALPNDSLALGRAFPMLRETVARGLISDTSSANAAYSFSTGLAEIIPVLDIPLNVADMIILTKAQALLVYKLGMSLGMPTDWQFYITELGSVIGSGFLWRQVARSLIGLIPAWGIVPKVAVAYSGTYAVGQAVLYWYLTGRHATKKLLKDFSREAFTRGKTIGQSLKKRIPRSSKKREALLAEGTLIPTHDPSLEDRICTTCSTINDSDAQFCKKCGEKLG